MKPPLILLMLSAFIATILPSCAADKGIVKSPESVEPPKTLIGTHAAAIIESVEQVVTQATETTPTDAPPKELDDNYRVNCPPYDA